MFGIGGNPIAKLALESNPIVSGAKVMAGLTGNTTALGEINKGIGELSNFNPFDNFKGVMDLTKGIKDAFTGGPNPLEKLLGGSGSNPLEQLAGAISGGSSNPLEQLAGAVSGYAKGFQDGAAAGAIGSNPMLSMATSALLGGGIPGSF